MATKGPGQARKYPAMSPFDCALKKIIEPFVDPKIDKLKEEAEREMAELWNGNLPSFVEVDEPNTQILLKNLGETLVEINIPTTHRSVIKKKKELENQINNLQACQQAFEAYFKKLHKQSFVFKMMPADGNLKNPQFEMIRIEDKLLKIYLALDAFTAQLKAVEVHVDLFQKTYMGRFNDVTMQFEIVFENRTAGSIIQKYVPGNKERNDDLSKICLMVHYCNEWWRFARVQKTASGLQELAITVLGLIQWKSEDDLLYIVTDQSILNGEPRIVELSDGKNHMTVKVFRSILGFDQFDNHPGCQEDVADGGEAELYHDEEMDIPVAQPSTDGFGAAATTALAREDHGNDPFMGAYSAE